MNWLIKNRRKPTDSERELLGFVARNECYQEDDGRSNTYLSEIFGLSDPWQDVTGDIAELESAGWVVLAERPHGVKLWQLTDAGRRIASKRD